MSNPSTLFDDDVTLTEDPEASTEAEIDSNADIRPTDRPQEWVYDEMPLEVLLVSRQSVAQLIRYALDVIDGTDQPQFHNKRDLGNRSGTTRHAVHRHIDELIELGIYTKRSEGIETYAPNPDSIILDALAECNEQIADRMLDAHTVLDVSDNDE